MSDGSGFWLRQLELQEALHHLPWSLWELSGDFSVWECFKKSLPWRHSHWSRITHVVPLTKIFKVSW